MPGHRMRKVMPPAVAFLFISLAFILFTFYSFVGQTSRYSVRRLRPAERLKSKQEIQEDVAAGIDIFNGIDLEFLPNFKNPCWYERQGYNQQEGNENNIYSALLKPASASVLANYRNQKRAGYILRCLPYFFLIGQPKCATTDVFQRINIHPDVAETLIKGPHWWTRRRYGQPYAPRPVTFMEYLDLFNGAAFEIEENWTNTTTSGLPYHVKITGDGSTSTLWDSGPTMNYLYSTLNKSSVDKLIQMFFTRREGLDCHPKKLDIDSLEETRDMESNASVFEGCGLSSQKSVYYQNYERTLYKQNYSIQPGVVLPVTVADIMHSVLPKSRIIAVIREPVSRLFSSYVFFTKNREKTPHAFDQDVQSSIRKWNNCIALHSERTCAYNKTLHNELEVRLYNGMYSIFLRDWLNVFPRDQVMVIRMEDYHQDIAATMASIYAHLGLRGLTTKEEKQVEMAPVQNTNRKKTDIGKMLNSTTLILRKFYEEYNRDLADLLDDLKFTWQDYYN